MLTSLRLKDWKSFGRGPALPFGRLTLLVGPNASGKSNLLDALKFLQGAALDLPVGDVLRGRYEGQREVWPGIRGHLAEVARRGTDAFVIEAEWASETNLSLTHSIEVNVDTEANISKETLRSGTAAPLQIFPARFPYNLQLQQP